MGIQGKGKHTEKRLIRLLLAAILYTTTTAVWAQSEETRLVQIEAGMLVDVLPEMIFPATVVLRVCSILSPPPRSAVLFVMALPVTIASSA